MCIRDRCSTVNVFQILAGSCIIGEIALGIGKDLGPVSYTHLQEKSCVEKYEKYANQARDPELKSLFQTLQKEEQKHYDSLGQVLAGTVPECNCNDSACLLYTSRCV